MKLRQGSNWLFWFSLVGLLAGILGLALWILPSSQRVERITYENVEPLNPESALNVEVTLPRLPVEGRDEIITLSVSGAEGVANQVYMARMELPLTVTPSGDVIEVSGSNSEAIFYWRFTPEKDGDGSGRIWLYSLGDSSEVESAELIGGIPIELTIPWWTRGWMAAGSGFVLLLSFVGIKYSDRREKPTSSIW
ncbi:MAG TPA: hypothetical protein VN226_03385 [Anaerolineales bacterium]|nr:hypothetical protein [Anaerolineales bacterium]